MERQLKKRRKARADRELLPSFLPFHRSSSSSAAPNSSSIPGLLKNFNTIEEFREADKPALFQSVVDSVRCFPSFQSTTPLVFSHLRPFYDATSHTHIDMYIGIKAHPRPSSRSIPPSPQALHLSRPSSSSPSPTSRSPPPFSSQRRAWPRIIDGWWRAKAFPKAT